MATLKNNASSSFIAKNIETSQQDIHEAPFSKLISELPIYGNTLLFGLNFKNTKIPKTGLINKFKGAQETMDLDLSCLVFDNDLEITDTVWFKKLRDSSNAIRHQGDSLNGKDRGAAAKLDRKINVETIELRLSRLPKTAQHVALLISCYNNQPLNRIERGNLYISNDEGSDIYSLDLALTDSKDCAQCVALLSRELNDWRLTIENLSLKSTNMDKMKEEVRSELARIYCS